MGRPKGATGPKRKMDKDPNKPKRPTSAYFYYMSDQRLAFAKAGKATNRVAEFTKEVSVKWRALTDAERIPFDKKAAIDKARYDREMAGYKGGKVKDANKPKRPQSAYFLFLADFRKQMAGKDVDHKDMLRMAGQEWNKLDAVKKRPYEAAAEVEKKKYEAAMKDYAAGGSAPKKARVEANNGAQEEDDEEEEDDDDEEDDEEDEEDDE